MNSTTQSRIQLVGRTLLALLFLISGIRKILGFGGTLGFMTKYNVPMPELLLILTIVIEVGAGAMLIAGFKARAAALLLAVFVAMVTPIFHAYWSVDPAQYSSQFNSFWKNVSIVGGLLYVWAFGAGAYSLDGRRGG